MAKDDAPCPERPPAKRRPLEQCPDVWLATWAGSKLLTPSERRRVEDERERRKATRRLSERRVGVVHDRQGVTAEQVHALGELLAAIEPSEIFHPGLQRAAHTTLRRAGKKIIFLRDDPKGVIVNAQTAIVLPRNAKIESEAWELARYAKHRGVALRIVLPDGSVLDGVPQTHDRRTGSAMQSSSI